MLLNCYNLSKMSFVRNPKVQVPAPMTDNPRGFQSLSLTVESGGF